MRGRYILAAPILALALLLAGCEGRAPASSPTPTLSPEATPTPTSTGAPEKTELVLPWYSSESIHPLTSANQTNLNLAPLMYEGLFQLDETFTPQELLCTGQSVSEDGLTWSFTLRSGVTFSDGSPLTSKEVVRSLQIAMEASSLYSTRLGNVKTVRADGEGAVSISLHMPSGNLPALLDVPIVKESGNLPLGTGAYVMDQEGGLLRQNTLWWKGGSLPVEEVRLYAVRTADALIHAFDTREVSLAAADLTGANALGFSGNYEVWDYPTSNMLYVGYNAVAGPCADPAVRRALSLHFDRAAVARSLLSGHAQAAELPFHPESSSYDADLAADLEYAPQALEGGMALTMVVNTDNSYKVAVAEFLADSLTQAGAAVELRKLTWEEYSAALAAGEFDLYLGQVRLTGDFDLRPLLTAGGALNFGGYTDPETDALLSAYLAASDITRPAAASDLARRIGEQAPFAVLCFKNGSLLTPWGKVSGVEATQQNLFYRFDGWKLS